MDLHNAVQLALPLIFYAEGCELASYLDTLATDPVWTIGHGTTYVDGVPVREGMTCTREQADAWAESDLTHCAGEVLTHIRVAVNDYQFAACLSLAYNIGVGGFGGSSVLEALNMKLYQQAADRFLEYDHADGVEVGGLWSRRKRERMLFLTGMGSATYPAKTGPVPAPAPAPAESDADRLNDGEIAAIARGTEGLT